MAVFQISVFTESKLGHLARILDLMKSADVNVRGYSVSDTGEYGIARFIVDDADRACAALKANNSAFTIKEVLCIKLDDVPGNLAKVMNIFAETGTNVNYSYSMISTYIIVCVDDARSAQKTLADRGLELIDQDDIARICASKL